MASTKARTIVARLDNLDMSLGVTNQRALARKALIGILSLYPQIYIISLRRRLDRREVVLRQLAQLDICIEDFGIEFFDALEFTDAGGFPSASVRGCFSSHRELMRRSSINNKHTLVIEDDVFFEFAALANCANNDSKANNDADLIYYGWLSAEPDTDSNGFIDTIGGHFYAVSPAFASAMYEFMDGCERRPAGSPEGGAMYRDAAFNFYRRRTNEDWRVKIIRPSLAGQFSSRSDLGVQRWWDSFKFLRPLVQHARHFKTRLRR